MQETEGQTKGQMAASGDGMVGPDSAYLAKAVGRPLKECLMEVTETRPRDPIEYIALWLYKYIDTRQYLRDKYQLIEDLEQKHKEIQAERQRRLKNIANSVIKTNYLREQSLGFFRKNKAYDLQLHFNNDDYVRQNYFSGAENVKSEINSGLNFSKTHFIFTEVGNQQKTNRKHDVRHPFHDTKKLRQHQTNRKQHAKKPDSKSNWNVLKSSFNGIDKENVAHPDSQPNQYGKQTNRKENGSKCDLYCSVHGSLNRINSQENADNPSNCKLLGIHSIPSIVVTNSQSELNKKSSSDANKKNKKSQKKTSTIGIVLEQKASSAGRTPYARSPKKSVSGQETVIEEFEGAQSKSTKITDNRIEEADGEQNTSTKATDNRIAPKGRKRHNPANSSIATWAVNNQNNLICQHPQLGDIQPRPALIYPETPEWWERQRFIKETLYDPEIYSCFHQTEYRDLDFMEEVDPMSFEEFVRPGPWVQVNGAYLTQSQSELPPVVSESTHRNEGGLTSKKQKQIRKGSTKKMAKT